MSKAIELLTCRLHGQNLGIPVRHVREVITPTRCTPIPLAHEAIAGLINLRGHVITQLDMRQALALPAREAEKAFRIVIIETDDGEDFGLMVDEVGEVMQPDAQIQEEMPHSLPACWRAVGSGVLKLEKSLLVLLDVERFIARTREMGDEQMPAEVEA
jgi:purine-binding chemotaxis protein CheW